MTTNSTTAGARLGGFLRPVIATCRPQFRRTRTALDQERMHLPKLHLNGYTARQSRLDEGRRTEGWAGGCSPFHGDWRDRTRKRRLDPLRPVAETSRKSKQRGYGSALCDRLSRVAPVLQCVLIAFRSPRRSPAVHPARAVRHRWRLAPAPRACSHSTSLAEMHRQFALHGLDPVISRYLPPASTLPTMAWPPACTRTCSTVIPRR
jgi:hypothetical protein